MSSHHEGYSLLDFYGTLTRNHASNMSCTFGHCEYRPLCPPELPQGITSVLHLVGVDVTHWLQNYGVLHVPFD